MAVGGRVGVLFVDICPSQCMSKACQLKPGVASLTMISLRDLCLSFVWVHVLSDIVGLLMRCLFLDGTNCPVLDGVTCCSLRRHNYTAQLGVLSAVHDSI